MSEMAIRDMWKAASELRAFLEWVEEQEEHQDHRVSTGSVLGLPQYAAAEAPVRAKPTPLNEIAARLEADSDALREHRILEMMALVAAVGFIFSLGWILGRLEGSHEP